QYVPPAAFLRISRILRDGPPTHSGSLGVGVVPPADERLEVAVRAAGRSPFDDGRASDGLDALLVRHPDLSQVGLACQVGSAAEVGVPREHTLAPAEDALSRARTA